MTNFCTLKSSLPSYLNESYHCGLTVDFFRGCISKIRFELCLKALEVNVWKEFLVRFRWGCGCGPWIRAARGARRCLEQGKVRLSVLVFDAAKITDTLSLNHMNNTTNQDELKSCTTQTSWLCVLYLLFVYSGQITYTDGRTDGSCWKTTLWAITSRRMNGSTAAGAPCVSARLSLQWVFTQNKEAASLNHCPGLM